MCGRMVHTHATEALARLFAAAPSNDLPEVPRYNTCPTQQVAVVTAEAGQRRLRPMRWGLVPHWAASPTDGPPLINARAETVADKPAFRAAVRARRCLVPASGFYEWTKTPDGARLPWFVRSPDGAPLAFAGIWQDWGREEARLVTVAIVTTAAGPDIAHIHHRQPLVIAGPDWPLWLGEAGKGAAMLMRPAPAGTFAAWRVDPAVNSNRAAGPELIEPI